MKHVPNIITSHQRIQDLRPVFFCKSSVTPSPTDARRHWLESLQGPRGYGLKRIQRNEEPQRNQTQIILIWMTHWQRRGPAQTNFGSTQGYQTQLGPAAERTTTQNVCFRLLSCLNSASVDTSPASEKHGTASAGPAQKKSRTTWTTFSNTSTRMLQTWRNLHGSTGSGAKNRLIWCSASNHKLYLGTARNITICVLRASDSLEESSTKKQQPHDAICMYERAAN